MNKRPRVHGTWLSDIPHRVWRFLPPLAVGGLALLLYASTAAPWITWANDGADGGDLIAAAMTGGVPHPSGYPTYCLLARLFALLPLGPIARRFNIFSATMAAASAVLVYYCALCILKRPFQRNTWLEPGIAFITALAWASGHTLWSQAIITEVYALQAFFTAGCLYLALRQNLLVRTRHWAALGLAIGLGLGVHLTLLLMLPAIAVLLWPQIKRERLIAICLGMLCGLAIYLYLPLAARRDPPINWGDPRTWAGFWWVVSAKPYQSYLFSLPLRYLPSRIGAWLQFLAQQYTWLGLALGLVGIGAWIEERRKTWAWATGLMFLVYTLYALTYDTTDSYVYLIPAHLIGALWMAKGAYTILTGLETGKARRGVLALGVILLMAIPIWSVACHYRELDLSGDDTARRWVDALLDDLPEEALLITGEDRHTFKLDYVLWVEPPPRDLLVIDGELLQYPWYVRHISRLYPSLRLDDDAVSLPEFVSANLSANIYCADERPDLQDFFRIEPQGVLWQIIGHK